MRYIKSVFVLLKNGQIKALLSKVKSVLFRWVYWLRAQWEDRKYGGVSINSTIPTRFADSGAKSTQSTNYIWLDKMFQSLPLKQDAVFVDVGCGEGRVLTYLYNKGFRGKMTGIELDPDVAETARHRTERCANITVLNVNVLEAGSVFEDATAVYLFNPFNEEVLTAFVALLERTCKHPVILYYSNDLYRRILDKRDNWHILRRNVLKVPGLPTRYYTIYRFVPEEKQG